MRRESRTKTKQIEDLRGELRCWRTRVSEKSSPALEEALRAVETAVERWAACPRGDDTAERDATEALQTTWEEFTRRWRARHAPHRNQTRRVR